MWPTSEPYLILHKVRGEPAFDIAVKMEVEGEAWWIIPTSGHRAYPCNWWRLEDLADASGVNAFGLHNQPCTYDANVPNDLPDHYENDKVTTGGSVVAVAAILALIGKAQPSVT